MKIGVIALVVAVSLPACAYQRSVPAAQLAKLREPGHGDAVVLRSRLVAPRANSHIPTGSRPWGVRILWFAPAFRRPASM